MPSTAAWKGPVELLLGAVLVYECCHGGHGGLAELGTNPECAVKSTDGFLTSASRIQVKRCRGRPPRGPAREADQRATSKVMLSVRINGYEISYPVLGNDKHLLSRDSGAKDLTTITKSGPLSVVRRLV